MIEAVGLQIFGNVGVDELHFAGLGDADIALGDRRLAGAQGFHFGAGENQARFKFFADLKFVPRLAVFRRDLEPRLRLLRQNSNS